ncbi:hypothetical protein, partial [Frisingicoccus sp.]|uniref:hypothetical protein n=1 Tax=Frisingicoccus sp. TaxID=1918627 RepID=UPI003AB8F577
LRDAVPALHESDPAKAVRIKGKAPLEAYLPRWSSSLREISSASAGLCRANKNHRPIAGCT